MGICPTCKSDLTHTHSVDDPIWIYDPIVTPLGLNGTNYRGSAPIVYPMIEQLQIYYGNLMVLLGMTPPTWLTRVQSSGHAQIEQLRICVELALTEVGLSINQYWAQDKYGNEWIGATQIDWTDVDRTIDGAPRLPKNCPIRAIHIEELRRGLLPGSVLWYEYWTEQPPNPLINYSGSWEKIDAEEAAIGKTWLFGPIYGDGTWYTDAQTWTYGDIFDYGQTSFSSVQSGGVLMSLAASTSTSGRVAGGSSGYVVGIFNSIIQLSDELLIQGTNKMKIRLRNTSVGGSNYQGILELDATIGLVAGGVASKTIVLASVSGDAWHAEGVDWHHVDEYGYLLYDPATGGIPYWRIASWQSLTSGTFRLSDIIEREYGITPAQIDYIRIWGIRIYGNCFGGKTYSVPPPYEGYPISGSGNISLSVGHIELIS